MVTLSENELLPLLPFLRPIPLHFHLINLLIAFLLHLIAAPSPDCPLPPAGPNQPRIHLQAYSTHDFHYKLKPFLGETNKMWVEFENNQQQKDKIHNLINSQIQYKRSISNKQIINHSFLYIFNRYNYTALDLLCGLQISLRITLSLHSDSTINKKQRTKHAQTTSNTPRFT